jgi:dipeptidyl aminopeptidase/acylaminoacyl peptidase
MGGLLPDLETVFSVPSVSHFDLAGPETPLKRRVLFSSNKSRRWQLYLGEIALSSSIREERQVTSGEDGATYGKLSPDGRAILFQSDHLGDEKYDIFITDAENPSKSRNLTPGTDFAINPNATFSPDGGKIALASNSSGQFAAYVLNVENGTFERITRHSYSDHYAAFSPNGRAIAIVSGTEGQDQGIFIATLDQARNDALRRLVDPATGAPIDSSDPSFSPDGDSIAFVSSFKDSYDIGLWNLNDASSKGGHVSWLTNSDHEYYDPSFSHDGKKLVYTMNMQGDLRLVIHDLAENRKSIVDFRHGIVASPRFTSDDKAIVFLFSSSKYPQDLWAYRLGDGKFLQLTNSLPPEIDTSSWVNAKHVEYPCKRGDGLKIPGLLYLPRGIAPENLPTVIEIHGGPTSQALNSWNPAVQLLVARNIAILRPNYRGSTGYGRKFREANRRVMGELDLADCVSAKDFLVSEGISDPKRFAVMGGSFGGYLTVSALAKYPDDWACGSALFPFLNWFTEIENEREDLRYWDLMNMGDPKVDAERLRAASPIFYMDQIRAPIQIIGGAQDPRCPLEESIQAREVLESKGKTVDFKAYEDEGHGFRKMENRVDAYSRVFAFLDKHLAHRN